MTSRTYSIRLTANLRAQIDSEDPGPEVKKTLKLSPTRVKAVSPLKRSQLSHHIALTHTETDAFRNGAPAKRTTLSRAHFCCKFLPLGVSALMDFAYLFVTYETIKTFYFNSFQNLLISFVLRVKKTVFIISILLNNCDIWRSV